MSFVCYLFHLLPLGDYPSGAGQRANCFARHTICSQSNCPLQLWDYLTWSFLTVPPSFLTGPPCNTHVWQEWVTATITIQQCPCDTGESQAIEGIMKHTPKAYQGDRGDSPSLHTGSSLESHLDNKTQSLLIGFTFLLLTKMMCH